MIERPIPRDIQSYEPKLIGPFTTRQVICGIPGFGLAIGAYFLLRGAIGDAALLVSLLIAAPFMLCGWYKPYGIPFDKYAKTVFVSMLLAPNKRKYKTENRYAFLMCNDTQGTNAKKKNKKAKTKPSSADFYKV